MSQQQSGSTSGGIDCFERPVIGILQLSNRPPTDRQDWTRAGRETVKQTDRHTDRSDTDVQTLTQTGSNKCRKQDDTWKQTDRVEHDS